MQNYHKHSSFSNIWGFYDSAAQNVQYAERAVELGHKVISSVEHGFQGNYHQCYELAKKYGLKFIFGCEAYWVKDRHKEYPVIDKDTGKEKVNKDGNVQTAKDRNNNHIILLAKNENGRQAINDILSEANETGYYFRPRIDLNLILSLPPDDVMLTTACVAFWRYKDSEDIIQQLHNHFGNNFYLEIQYHNTDEQKKLNQKILSLSEKYNIEMIVGLDSHYIYPEQAKEREYMMLTNGSHYDDDGEAGWYMDYPDNETVINRFLEQGVFTKEQIQRAMDNTDVLLTFEGYDTLPDGSPNPIFSTDIKLPTLYDGKHIVDGKLFPKLTQEERNKEYSKLITKLFKEYMNGVDPSEYDEYFNGVKSEVQVVKDTNMSDYFMIDYYIVKRAIELGGILTNSGRGSSVGYFTNTLLGFSKVDRFQSPIKLYPERFISKSRILETRSLPDIDLNWGTPDIAAQAQEEILGTDHAYPMIAFGTCKKKSAFKLYARSQNMDFELANTISSQIEQYDDALKYAEDDEKDDINIYDYVDEQYHPYLDASKKYWGIISDKKKAPCAYLLYAGSIRKEIGLIKCKSTTTKKEYITAVIDGAVAENYKFLKNDILKVDVVLLVDLIYKRIGIKPHTVNELMKLVKNDKAVWDIYSKGYTMGVNQVEKASTTRKSIKYQPKNVSELSAFIAAIRPAFKSMYSKFESREDFSYDIPAFDKILQTEELPQSFILYQEQTMNTLNYAGFPIDECYGIIKAIAKKHPEKVRPLKERFINGFRDRIMEEGTPADKAEEDAARVWQIISDSCGYGFNCVSGDTRIMKSGRNGGFEPTVAEMYNIMNSAAYAKATGHYNLHKKYQLNGYGYALSMFDDNIIRQNRIVTIDTAGYRQTYKVVTSTGRSICCTDNHKFPTPNGKKRLDELKIGDGVYCMGEYQSMPSDGIQTYIDTIVSITPHKLEMTYDIEMADPAHTFVSENGLVVSNSAHAYCMALDSLYNAYLKAHYPYEFYEVLLQTYSDKGKKDKVAELKQEMNRAFGIQEGDYRFGLDNRKFVADPENHTIYPSLLSIKGLSQGCANDLYAIGKKKFNNYYELWKELKKKKSLNSAKINTLIEIGYFDDFASIGKIKKFMEILDKLYDRSQFSKANTPKELLHYIEKYSEQSDKQYRKFDYDRALIEIWNDLPDEEISTNQRLKYELDNIGYIKTVFSDFSPEYAFVQNFECKFKNPKLTLYRLCDGSIEVIKVKKKKYDESPIQEGDIIKTIECSYEGRWLKDSNGDWQQNNDNKEWILKKWSFVR